MDPVGVRGAPVGEEEGGREGVRTFSHTRTGKKNKVEPTVNSEKARTSFSVGPGSLCPRLSSVPKWPQWLQWRSVRVSGVCVVWSCFTFPLIFLFQTVDRCRQAPTPSLDWTLRITLLKSPVVPVLVSDALRITWDPSSR